MCRCFVLIFSLLLAEWHIALSFEIEKANDDYNIVFVKNKRSVNDSKKKTNATNNTLKKVNTDSNKAVKPVSSNTKMYASATGNLSIEDANTLLKGLIGEEYTISVNQDSGKKNKTNVQNNTKQKTNNKQTTNTKKTANTITKDTNTKNATTKNTKTSKTGASKVVVSYNGDSVAVDNELCKLVARNDVVNVKKTLSMMKYNSKYVNWRCEHNTPLLLLAVEHNNLLVAKLLVEKGANVNLVDDAGVSPLHWIARSSDDGMLDMFALIISTDNLAVNIRDIEGYTPLMRAVEVENITIVNALLERQADVYIKNNYGESAIKLARKRLEAKRDNDNKTNIERILGLLELKV